jgi:hypothetical protein
MRCLLLFVLVLLPTIVDSQPPPPPSQPPETTPASGINYSEPYVTSDISDWAIRDGTPYSTILQEVSLRAPADGFVVITATGDGCIYSETGHIAVWLSDNPDNTSFNYLGYNTITSIANYTQSPQPCAVGQQASFAFQHVQPVTRDTLYTYYLKGHKGSAETEATVTVSPVLVTYYPVQY